MKKIKPIYWIIGAVVIIILLKSVGLFAVYIFADESYSTCIAKMNEKESAHFDCSECEVGGDGRYYLWCDCASGYVYSNYECIPEEEECDPHTSKACRWGDVWWKDCYGNWNEVYDYCDGDETCENARCVAEETGCTDSDGSNYYNKGYVTVDGVKTYDRCITSSLLGEQKCVDDAGIEYPYECPCSNGKCDEGVCDPLVYEDGICCTGESPISLDCAQQPSCTPHSYFQCSTGDVYWFDSCGVREEKIDDCLYGCTGTQCDIPGGCTVTILHASLRCYGGDVYWYDNCGDRTNDKYKECGTNECSEGQCITWSPDTCDPLSYGDGICCPGETPISLDCVKDCYDSDGGIRKYTKGTIYIDDVPQGTDFCITEGGTTLREYFCDAPDPKGYDDMSISCDAGYKCENGVCKADLATMECVDSDDGQKPLIKGTIEINGAVKASDGCITEGGTTVREYFCDDSDPKGYDDLSMSCSLGYKCQDGYCQVTSVITLDCYQCKDGHIVSQKINGTSCPTGWQKTAPEDCGKLVICEKKGTKIPESDWTSEMCDVDTPSGELWCSTEGIFINEDEWSEERCTIYGAGGREEEIISTPPWVPNELKGTVGGISYFWILMAGIAVIFGYLIYRVRKPYKRKRR